jgi:hypothetical protein
MGFTDVHLINIRPTLLAEIQRAGVRERLGNRARERIVRYTKWLKACLPPNSFKFLQFFPAYPLL